MAHIRRNSPGAEAAVARVLRRNGGDPLRQSRHRATSAVVTTGPGAIAATQEGADKAAPAWRAVRGMEDIQFTPVQPDPPQPPPESPGWIKSLGEAIGTFFDWLGSLFEPLARLLGASWSGIEVLLLVLAGLGAAWIAWVLLWPLWRDRKPRVRSDDAAGEWVPPREAALALLEDADRLASEGRFEEATHLLLMRSVGHIAEARPDWLSPSSTAREIGAIAALPARARDAFGIIAREVERSLFALRGLGADDWRRARAAYADFALADLKAAA